MEKFLKGVEDANAYGAAYKVLDVGSRWINGSYREMVEEKGWDYTGLDLVAGRNVDVVATQPYTYDFDDGSFDVVISGSTMEHVQDLATWVFELTRLVRPAGWLIILTVNEWVAHRHPVDCWRILPDGMTWLCENVLHLWPYTIGAEGRDTWVVARKYAHWATVRGRDMLPQERGWLSGIAEGISRVFEMPTILNIGVRHGASMYCLRSGSPQARLIGIDIDMSQLWNGPQLGTVRLIEADSRECHQDITGPVHIVFFDSDHHKEVIEKEIELYVPKVPVGGIVVFHDYYPKPGMVRRLPHLADVRRAVDKWVKDPTARDVWVPISVPMPEYSSLAAWRRQA